jgi:predicted outer membrane repeat protein
VALGPASAQAALAKPQNVAYVPCSASALAAALSSASSGDTLFLAPGCTYELTAALPNITTDLHIVGNGATLERSYAPGTPDFTILTVTGGNLTLIGVDFRNGICHHGGAIYNDGGNVTVRGGTFIGNRALYYGGAIANYSGYVTVLHARFIGNSSSGEGGYGGAIYNDDGMTVIGSDFLRNRAEWGGAIYNEYIATLTGDSFAWNYAYSGGGLYNDDDATVNGGTFGQNHADYGAGIYNNDTLTLWHTLITFNVASNQGGGIYNYGTLTANDSHILGNQAPGGGGGIYNYDGTVTLNNTVVFVNVPDNCEPLGTIAGCVG